MSEFGEEKRKVAEGGIQATQIIVDEKCEILDINQVWDVIEFEIKLWNFLIQKSSCRCSLWQLTFWRQLECGCAVDARTPGVQIVLVMHVSFPVALGVCHSL